MDRYPVMGIHGSIAVVSVGVSKPFPSHSLTVCRSLAHSDVVRSFVRSFVRSSFDRLFVRSFVPSFLRSFVPSFLRCSLSLLSFVVVVCVRSFAHSFVRSFVVVVVVVALGVVGRLEIVDGRWSKFEGRCGVVSCLLFVRGWLEDS